MPQLFSPRATSIFRALLVLVPVTAASSAAAAYVWARSDGRWNVGVAAAQPIPFQHDLHSGRLGIDCRFCHAGAERAASAGMPSAETCMNCHAEVWAGVSVLEPLRTALALHQPVAWRSVSRLPDYSYFHHAAHVTKGVACETCHGRVDRMTETVRTQAMSMGWCLDCHRDPAAGLRPPDAVWTMGWVAPADAVSASASRTFDHAAIELLTSCSTCHR